MTLNRLDWTVIALLALLFIVDATQRIYQPSADADARNEAQLNQDDFVTPQLLNNQQLADILASYSAYHDSGTGDNVQAPEMDPAFLAGQEGELSELFTESYRFRLRATFIDSSGSFALLESQSLSANNAELVKVLVNDNLHGYQIHSIAETRVVMKRADKTVELKLYQP